MSAPSAALAFVSFGDHDGVPSASAWLTPAGADYARRLLRYRRAAWLAGRLAAKTAIARVAPSAPLHEIEVLPAADGAPVVRNAGGAPSAIAVSISHTRSLAAAVAFDPRAGAVGIDVEVRDQTLDPALLDFAFSAEERHVIDVAGDAGGTHQRVLAFWTAKEAALKAVRRGLRLPLDAVRLVWDARTVPVSASVTCAPGVLAHFALTTTADDGYVLSIAREMGR
jgi:4'-phosphopantetheinyl transferase